MNLDQATEEIISGFKTIGNWEDPKLGELMQHYAEFRKLNGEHLHDAMELAYNTHTETKCSSETAIRWALLQYALKLGLTITK